MVDVGSVKREQKEDDVSTNGKKHSKQDKSNRSKIMIKETNAMFMQRMAIPLSPYRRL